MDSVKKPRNALGLTIQFFQIVMNVSLVITALLLCYLLGREIYSIFSLATGNHTNVHEVLQEVLVFFLYFGFVSMILKYFKEDYHFPLRYLLYIGITATIRFIIVNRDDAYQNLMMALVVLLLLFGYIALYKFQIKQ